MSTEVTFNADEHQYEIRVGGTFAGLTKAEPRQDGVVVFPHTVIEDEFEGHHLGEVLVGQALDDVRSKGQTIQPTCPYVAHFLAKHPEYADLVA